MSTLVLILASVGRFARLAWSRKIHLRQNRLGKSYKIENSGTYSVFRETTGNDGIKAQPVVLVVGFRLKVIRSNELLHWLFQRVCILTTPFWSGFKGFRIKLWMVDPKTKNYLGIYKWAGEDYAKTYAESLLKILKPLSIKGSVWYKIYPTDFETYLKEHSQ